MTIPSHQDAMLPVLRVLADGEARHRKTLAENMADYFNLTAEERSRMLPSKSGLVIASRTGWALAYMKQAGLVTTVRRGWYQITDLGKNVLASSPSRIDNEYLERFEGFRDFKARSQSETEAELSDAVKRVSPTFFEELVIDLLVAMGYGGNRLEAARAIGKTGDGGIDGVIDEDRLGLDSIYVQAKRWEGESVLASS